MGFSPKGLVWVEEPPVLNLEPYVLSSTGETSRAIAITLRLSVRPPVSPSRTLLKKYYLDQYQISPKEPGHEKYQTFFSFFN